MTTAVANDDWIEFSYTPQQWQAVEAVLRAEGIIPDIVAETAPLTRKRRGEARPRSPRTITQLRASLEVELHFLSAGHYARRKLPPSEQARLHHKASSAATGIARIREGLEIEGTWLSGLTGRLRDIERDLIKSTAKPQSRQGRPPSPIERLEFCLAILKLWHFGFGKPVSTYEEGPLIAFMCAAIAPASTAYPLDKPACKKFIGRWRPLLERLDQNEYLQLQELFGENYPRL